MGAPGGSDTLQVKEEEVELGGGRHLAGGRDRPGVLAGAVLGEIGSYLQADAVHSIKIVIINGLGAT